jgi:4-amino-4-deoxy-L-arabinose transferase-like glycosyltransferase
MTTAWALAFFLLHEFQSNPKRQTAFLSGFYVLIGISLLAKGLVGIVIPAGVVGLYFLLERRLPRRSTLMSVVWGVPLALIVASVCMYGHPATRLALHRSVSLFSTTSRGYVSNKYHHRAAFYYYLLILPLLALPWTAFFIDALAQARRWLTSRPEGGEDRVRSLMVFALAWILFPLIFFSASSS